MGAVRKDVGATHFGQQRLCFLRRQGLSRLDGCLASHVRENFLCPGATPSGNRIGKTGENSGENLLNGRAAKHGGHRLDHIAAATEVLDIKAKAGNFFGMLLKNLRLIQ